MLFVLPKYLSYILREGNYGRNLSLVDLFSVMTKLRRRELAYIIKAPIQQYSRIGTLNLFMYLLLENIPDWYGFSLAFYSIRQTDSPICGPHRNRHWCRRSRNLEATEISYRTCGPPAKHIGWHGTQKQDKL